jgi:hypothetical protein
MPFALPLTTATLPCNSCCAVMLSSSWYLRRLREKIDRQIRSNLSYKQAAGRFKIDWFSDLFCTSELNMTVSRRSEIIDFIQLHTHQCSCSCTARSQFFTPLWANNACHMVTELRTKPRHKPCRRPAQAPPRRSAKSLRLGVRANHTLLCTVPWQTRDTVHV